jgi:endoglucanase
MVVRRPHWTAAAAAALAVVLAGCAGCIPKKSAGGAGTGAENTADGKACGPDGTIDDAEDGDHKAAAIQGRGGYWHTFADKVGTTVSPPAGAAFEMGGPGANGSTHAAHIQGKVGTGDVVFAGVGLNLVDPKGPYDASGYGGVSFWARRAAGSTGKVRLKVPDASTDPDGKVCTECFNDFGADLEIGEAWARYVVPFSAMAQLSGWGAPRPATIDRSKIYALQWQVNAPGAAYDLWIDDVQFTGCR